MALNDKAARRMRMSEQEKRVGRMIEDFFLKHICTWMENKYDHGQRADRIVIVHVEDVPLMWYIVYHNARVNITRYIVCAREWNSDLDAISTELKEVREFYSDGAHRQIIQLEQEYSAEPGAATSIFHWREERYTQHRWTWGAYEDYEA